MRPIGRYHHGFWFALLLATAVTMAGASLAAGAYIGAASPETVVRAYFAALAAGDAAGALGYGTVPGGRRDLLTADALAAQNAVAPITGLAVWTGHRAGDNALVDVTYVLDLPSGRTSVSDAVPVVRQGHGWRLVRSAVAKIVRPGNGSMLATFAGAAIPSGAYPMFPGAVPVSYETPILQPDADSSVVRFTDLGDLEVTASVSRAGQAAIASSLKAALAECLAGRSRAEALCPVPDRDKSVPGSLRGTTNGTSVGPPLLTVQTATGKIGITEEANVHAKYQRLDENNLSTTSTVQSVGLYAHCYATVPGVIVWDIS
ncbi:MAG TPA: hypothetical protein VH352_20995 [Pseudonocardiaceae bacterium]|nr:hypothetical protein [Pseudonocardiaceae bacterium]